MIKLPVSESWRIGWGHTDERGLPSENFLCIWPSTIKDGDFGTMICKVSPESLMNEQDMIHATLIAAAPDTLRALVHAREVIKTWHNMSDDDGTSWSIYEKNSPEMKVINDAILRAIYTPPEPLTLTPSQLINS